MSFEFPDLVTRREAAQIMRVSIRTLKRLEERKELQPVHITSNVIGYRAADLKRYLVDRGLTIT